jgi:FtsP/CotA-like multicopper oxidase with cupredoxin domain
VSKSNAIRKRRHRTSRGGRRRQAPCLALAALVLAAGAWLTAPGARAQGCDGFVLADGVTCVPGDPVFDPEEANQFAREGTGGVSEDPGQDINTGNLSSTGKFDIPTGASPSPLFGAQPWTQRMLRFEEFGPEPLVPPGPGLPATTAILADTCGLASDPNANFGSASTLQVDGDSAKHAFIRVQVTNVGSATVISAVLRMRVASGSRAASDSGGRVHVAPCAWDEATMTWNTRPLMSAAVLDSAGPVATGAVVEFDVTAAITGDGIFCFGLDSLSSDGVDYNSREAASGRPEVIVSVSGGSSGPCEPFPPPLGPDRGPASAALDDFLEHEVCPFPSREANTTDRNPWQPEIEAYIGRALDDPPAEGRPPGENWAHQRWDEFFPEVYYSTAQAGARTNRGLRDARQLHGYAVGEWGAAVPGQEGQTGLYHNTTGQAGFDGTTTGIAVRFHPNFPVQDPNALWTFDGTFPPKLLMVRYGQPVLMRHYNALPIDPSANFGFGLHTITTHEHNGHQPAESDGFTQAFFFPGQFYDYRWPLALAGHDSINTNASDPRAGAPDGHGGIVNIPGDWRETMSTHWFHDHMLDFTAQNVYKGNAVMMNYYSSVDRGREPTSAAEAAGDPANPGYGCHYANPSNVNLCLPSGSGLDWGNRSYDVNLLLADKAWDQQGQLFFNIFNLDGFLGDNILVNWLYKPYFEVRARRYRFRILNGSVSRYFRLALVTQSNAPVPFYMVANDGNLMEHAVFFPNGQLPTQGIAERYDIVVDFSQFAPGTKLYMVNLLEHRNGRRPHEAIALQEVLSGEYRAVVEDGRWEDGDPAVGKFLELRVVAYGGVDRSMNPAEYVPGGKKMIPLPVITQAELDNALHRTFVFGRSSGTDEAPWTIKTDGGSGFNMDPRRLSAAPTEGALEIWHIRNGGNGWSHPVHIHFEEGRILRRGGLPPPPWEEWARKDVYRIGRMPDSTDSVDVALRFREFMGSYMEHCHNTQHEDHAMLLRWDIERPGQVKVMPTPMPTWDGVTYVDSVALPTFRTGDLDTSDDPECGDGSRNQPGEQCDGLDDAGCPGQCRADCTCPGAGICGDDLVNQPNEDCDGIDDAACPGHCDAECMCTVLPVCGDNMVNLDDEECDGTDAAGCPGACRVDCTCPVAATTSTTAAPTTSTTTTTTTTLLPPGPVSLFCDTFGGGLANWSESGEGDWNTEALHATTNYPGTGSGSPAAHSDNCDTTCTITLAGTVNLGGRTAATLTLLRFVDSELDAGEYLRLEAWNGTWQTLADWSADNGSDTNQWHAHSIDLAAYLGRPDFRIRFVTHSSNTSEHVQVDDVCVTAYGGGATTTTLAPTTTTAPPTTTTTTGGGATTTTTLGAQTIVASVVADAFTDANNPSSNFGTRTAIEVDGSPVKTAFVRISVSGIGGRTVTSARLRLVVTNESNSGGQIRRIAGCAWTETGITANNQPSLTAVGSPGPVLGTASVGQAVLFDLPGLTADGTHCYAITTTSTNGVDYSSREASSNRPAVEITVAP